MCYRSISKHNLFYHYLLYPVTLLASLGECRYNSIPFTLLLSDLSLLPGVVDNTASSGSHVTVYFFSSRSCSWVKLKHINTQQIFHWSEGIVFRPCCAKPNVFFNFTQNKCQWSDYVEATSRCDRSGFFQIRFSVTCVIVMNAVN